jgi:putative transposase
LGGCHKICVNGKITNFYTGEKNMAIRQEILNELLKEYKNPADLLGKGGIIEELQKRLLETAMEAEMDHHLGYKKNDPIGNNSGNSRNGRTTKRVKSKDKEFEIIVPRDRNSEFEPQIIPKHSRRFDGFDDKIISMYARGMTVREIKSHLEEIYHVDVSPDLISTVTSAVIDDAIEWQNRPLDNFYPIVFLDALRIKIRQDHKVINKAVYLAIAINMDGCKEVLGIWFAENEGAKFWLSVLTEIQNRGVEDILIASVDGLKGFPEAIESVFPQTEIQLCIVHMVRHSLKYVPYIDRKQVAADLKKIYTAKTTAAAEKYLEEFKKKWDKTYPSISQSWSKNWEHLTHFLEYTEEIRRVIYTTNAIESLNMSLRKILKSRASFPNDEAAFKLLYLGLNNISKKWTMPFRNWGKVVQQFAVKFEGRVPLE